MKIRLGMKFFNFNMVAGDDVLIHVTKLKKIWNILKIELEKKENSDFIFMCQVIGTLPNNFLSFSSSWRMLNKMERTTDNFTSQLCAFERTLQMKNEQVRNQAALLVKTTTQKEKNKGEKGKSKYGKSNNGKECHYCKQKGCFIRQCEKWISDGRPPKKGTSVTGKNQ